MSSHGMAERAVRWRVGVMGIDFCCASAVAEQSPMVSNQPVFLEQRGKSMPELMETDQGIRQLSSFYDGCDGGDSFPFFKYRPRFLFPYSEQRQP